MTIGYLLDTNTASYVIKGTYPQVLEHLRRVPMAKIGISVITEAELHYGVECRKNSAKLELAVREFLLRVEVLDWNSAAARRYAQLRARLEAEGRPLGNMDLLIAAHALAAEAVLVTHDKVFRWVKGLRLEDWTE